MEYEILFFTEKITPRLRYTVGSIVGNLLSVSFVFTEDKAFFVSSNLPKINYSKTPISDNEVIIEPQNLLFETTIEPYLMESENDFFMNKINAKNEELIDSELDLNANNQANLGNNLAINLTTNYAFDFDIFSRIFYLASRYEEYKRDPSVYDAFGRFPSTESVASKLNFLQQPIVNQYVIALSEKLKSRFPNFEMRLPTYRFQPSFDFDMAWLYRNKGFLRNAGGLFKDVLKGQFDAVKKRLNILVGTEKDPYFNFDFIKALHQKYELNLMVFWLLGDLAKYDKNIAWTHPEFQSLIQSFAADFRVGIHPSYRSNESVSILQKEVNRLTFILKKDEKNAKNAVYTEGSSFPSRQHFLKLTFPETYRRLLAVDVREDWTMGYADDTGFRAGIATPFPWFDLEKNEETALIIHPFQAMDVTLKNYLHLSPEAATGRLRDLIAATKAVGGTFTSLWHNDNLAEMDDWHGWRVVYERLLEDAI